MRFPVLKKSELDADQKDLWDQIVNGPRGFYCGGPDTEKLPDLYNAYLHFPEIGRCSFSLADRIKKSRNITGAMRELLILTVSRSLGNMVEFDFHVPFALREGIPAAVVDELRAGERSPGFASEGERLVHEACLQLLDTATLTQDLKARLRDGIGFAGMMELISAVSLYTIVAYTSNVAEVALADDFSADAKDLSRFFTGKPD